MAATSCSEATPMQAVTVWNTGGFHPDESASTDADSYLDKGPGILLRKVGRGARRIAGKI
jgi:hypothetical protein